MACTLPTQHHERRRVIPTSRSPSPVHLDLGMHMTSVYGSRNQPITCAGVVLSVVLTVMFSRVVTAAGAPPILNFAHLGLAPCLLLLVFVPQPSTTAIKIFWGIMALFVTIVVSTIANAAGPANAVLDFLILAEPFLIFMAITVGPWRPETVRRFRMWLFAIALIHMCFSLVQWVAPRTIGDVDRVKGLFLRQGGGSHIGGALALTAAVYFFWNSPLKSLWQRLAVSAGLVWVVIASDSKSAIAVFIASIPILAVSKITNVVAFSKYIIRSIAFILALFFAVKLISPGTWDHYSHRFSHSTIGIEHKLSVLTIIKSYHESSMNSVFGLGPGHTMSRVATIIPDYYDLLRPFGVTTNPATNYIISENAAHWLSNPETGSSVWALTFSWAAIWGDLGFLGLVVYVALWTQVGRVACTGQDQYIKVLFLVAMLLGGVFTYLEEPGYVVYVVSVLGLAAQQRHLSYARAGLTIGRKSPSF